MARPIISGNLARHPVIQNSAHRVAGDLKNADRIMTNGLYWGCHPDVTEEQIELLSKTVHQFFAKKSK